MAAKKKETQNTQNVQPAVKNQMLLVDAGKLSQGLKTTFEGVALVFDSIGVAADFTVPEGKPSEEAVKEQVAKDPDDNGAEVKAAEVKADETKTSAAEPEKEEVTTAKADTEEAPAEETAATVETPAPSVTIDDITKIIVQKIKKNRSNNEKIGAILKTYGVSKVGDLKTDKYEAFLTDLSAI